MQIVIDIPERVYTYLTKECSGLVDDCSDSILLHLAKGVIQGTVLPNGHGDLIDCDAFRSVIPTPVEDEYKYIHKLLYDAPVVVPADEEE